MTTDRDDMARIIALSCSTKMKPETATHYADNLIAAGYGKLPVPARESPEWAALCTAAEELGKAAALFANAKDDYTTRYPREDS
jgi:hypothetical protein